MTSEEKEILNNTLFLFWDDMLEKKLSYTEWFYGEGGVADAMLRTEKVKEVYKVKIKIK